MRTASLAAALETSRTGYVMVSLSNLDPRRRQSSWGFALPMPDR
jgi:hypothetical protein